MKNLKKVAEETKKITGWSNRIPLFYDIEKDAVYTKSGTNRYHITDLIRENTPKDIKDAVNRYMAL